MAQLAKSNRGTGDEEYVLNGHDSHDEARNNDEERVIGLDSSNTSKEEEEPAAEKRGRLRRSQDGRSLKTTRSHQSRAGGDGYTCFDNDRPNKSKVEAGSEEPFLVSWDGDADPDNPRSMTKLRRWMILLICSASSLCV